VVRVRRRESGGHYTECRTEFRLRRLRHTYNKDVPLNFKVQQGRATRKKGELLDFAFLAAESQPHNGEIRALAFRLNGNDVLVVVGAGFQFHLVAAVVGLAL